MIVRITMYPSAFNKKRDNLATVVCTMYIADNVL